MTRHLGSVLMFLAAILPAAERELPLQQPGSCAAETRPGDSVTLSPGRGHLAIDYDVAVDRSHRVGHQTMRIGGFRLMLQQPLTVQPGEARIVFAACGAGDAVQLRPLLRDANGEELSYSPHPADLLLTGGAGTWRDWRTCVFTASEAGGAQQDIYEGAGGDGNAWPDGALTLVGFEARMIGQDGQPPRARGSLVLGRAALAGNQVNEGDPACYADALLREAGHYRLGIQVRAAYQGLPIAEEVRELDYDPADPLSRGQRLVLPDRGLRLSWIRLRAERGGSIAAEQERRWERDLAPGGAIPPAVDPARAPAIGRLRFNPQANTIGTYRDGEALRVTVRVFAGAAPEAALQWKLGPVAFAQVLASGEERIAFAGAPFRDVTVAVPATAVAAVYQLQTTLVEGGAQVDRGSYRFGRSPAAVAPYAARSGILRGREFVKRQPYVRTTYLPPEGARFADPAAAVAHFAAMLEATAAVTSYVTVMIDLAEFEVLPGVYDLDLLDRMMDAAADRGCALTIRFAHCESQVSYPWQPYTRPRTWDGVAAEGHRYYGAFAVADEEFIGGWLRAFRTISDRYARHPAFQGYYLMQPSGEWNVPDQPWNGTITGYAWADLVAFRAWLQSELKLDLAGLNARWGSAHATWDAVRPPQPDFSRGTAPDLRRAWLDFCRFKRTLEDGWFPRVCRTIRAYDRDHVLIVYGGQEANGTAQPGVLQNADYLHNGGNHFLQGEGGLIPAWDAGLGWITEPHHPHRWAAYGEPGERGWVLDWSVFVMTAQAGAGGANLHVYYHPSPTLDLVAHQGGEVALDRLQQYRPILGELHGLRLAATPKQVAVFQDDETLFCKHRTVFASRREDLRRWFEQLKADAVPFESFVPAHAADYKLLVLNPLDEVMSGASIDTIERLVKDGATVLIAGRAGRYCPDLGNEEWPLLRRLGLPPPTGAWRTADDAATATATASPLAAAGAAIPFYSQADNARELQDPAIGARFFSWPYRWIPRSDYFGRFAGIQPGGEILARFADGGAALSQHQVGKGRVVVCWGTPRIGANPGFMARLAAMCGVQDPAIGRPIPLMLEGRNPELNRGYALLYQERAGTYTVKIPSATDGEWFLDDMVAQQRLGIWSGAELRERGLPVTFVDGYPPLKVLRLLPRGQIGQPWATTYRKSAP